MPLMKRKSKAAFEHNIKAEMEAGKPQKQSLAIAYSVKRKAKKASGGTVKSGSEDMNYAKGGPVEDSARSESRPMPDKRYNDSKEAARNSGNKAPSQDSWTDKPTEMQAKAKDSRKVMPIKYPKMVPQNSYSVRLRDEEDDLQRSAKVNEGPQRQPPEHDNEEGPDRQGPKVSDMQDEHSTHRKPYAKGGMIDDMRHASKHDMEPADHDIQEEEREDEAHLQSMEAPSEDEGSMDAHSRDEEGQNRQGPKVPDMEEPHNDEEDKVYGYADGGMIDNEEEIEHAASIAAAIMMKMRKKMAEGGEINGRDSIYAHPEEDQADLSRNAEEAANMEDQSSFDALRKESYSESEGLEALDQPHDSNLKGDSEEDDSENINDGDIVSAIRAKMKRRSPISR